MTDADSTEVREDAPHKVIYKLRDLLGVDDLGGTMRLGSYACRAAPDSLAQRLYGEENHPRAPSPSLRVQLPLREAAPRSRPAGSSGRSLDGKFVEIVELPGHPWYIAVQFHPEFKSKPTAPASALRRRSSRPPTGARPRACNGQRRSRWPREDSRGWPPVSPDGTRLTCPRIMSPVIPVSLGDVVFGGGARLCSSPAPA